MRFPDRVGEIVLDHRNVITAPFAEIDVDEVLSYIDVMPKTKLTYKNNVYLFIDWLAGKSLQKNSLILYKEYVNSLANLSNNSKRLRVNSLLAFFKACYKHGFVGINLTHNVKSMPGSKKHLRDGLNEEDVAKIQKYLKIVLQPGLHRDRLLMQFFLMVYCGLRQNEVLSIRRTDFRNNTLFIKGKGRYVEEPVYVPEEARNALNWYMKKYPQEYLFDKGKGYPTTANAMHKQWKRVFFRIGISMEKSVHGFRHYFVTKLLDVSSGDVSVVMDASRLKSLETVKAYDDERRQRASLPKLFDNFIIGYTEAERLELVNAEI